MTSANTAGIDGSPQPKVCVLLATYNGAKWIDEQLNSIVCQQGVRIVIVASDDSSSDGTTQRLMEWHKRCNLTLLRPSSTRFGSAHRNFLRLIRDVDPGDADFVALCDQDDIWLPDKMLRAIDCLGRLRADAYSSDVTAFWPDGRQRLLRKSHPQRRYDHLFGSPGPGCTYVLPRTVHDALRLWISAGFDGMQNIWVHDWLIYAYVRGRGLRWHIDNKPGMLYRQHDSNEIGANQGFRAARVRWLHVRSGAYRRDILSIAEAIGDQSSLVQAIRRLSLLDRLRLLSRVREMRRKPSEMLIMAALILSMPRLR